MKKAKILEEMKAALERYRTIKEEEFDFSYFVSNFDPLQKCGTICCLWGWEPRFGVLEEVKWCHKGLDSLDILISPTQYLGWGNIVRYLYFPSYTLLPKNLPELRESSTLQEVLQAWELVIEKIGSGDTLDHLLNLDSE